MASKLASVILFETQLIPEFVEIKTAPLVGYTEKGAASAANTVPSADETADHQTRPFVKPSDVHVAPELVDV